MFYISLEGEQIYKPLDDLLILFSPKLTLEIGKAGSLEFDIPPNNPFYDKLNQLTTEVTVDMDSEEIFHGRVLSSERTFNNIKHVYCEGDLSYLIDSVQKGEQYNGTTHDLFRKIIANHNARVDAKKRFTVGTINIENRSVIIVGKSTDVNVNVGIVDYKQIALDSIADEWSNSFDYIQNCLIDYCGGYLRTRRVNGVNYIDLLDDFGSTASQEIELGRNLLDLTEELTIEDVFTVLIPLGDENLTIAAVNGGSDELVDTAAVAKYGRIVRTHVFNSVTSPYTLLENGRRFLAANLNIPRTVTVRAVDLHLINKNINPIKIGDKVEITSYVHEVSDTLMCTKIEYDLERPENNNYTFGNPKQTLTQRYREDQRANSSANTANPSSASAAGASAAAATAKKAKEEKDKSLQDFYDAWIKCDPDTGQINLGALYKKYLGDRQVLISQCGIKLDGETGNVNIESLHKQVTDQGRIIGENSARIGIVETDTSVAIENVTDRQEHLANVEATHHTEVTQRCDELGSAIDLMARDINEFEDRTTTTTANINMRADDLESRVGLNASYISQIDNREISHFATIQTWANETESAIQLKADKIYVDGQLQATIAQIDDLTAGRTTAAKIRATDILAGSISVFSEGGATPVATMQHSHNFAIIEGNNGDITISIGAGTTTIPQQQSFNIANTKYYKDNVAAVSIKSLDPDSYSSSGDYTATLDDGYVRYSNEQLTGRIRITLGNNDTKTAVIRMSGTRAFNAGVDAGAQTAEIGSVAIGSAGQPSKSDEDNVYYARVRVTAVARGRKSDNTFYTDDSFSRNISIDVTEVYNAGKAAGSESGSDDVSVTSLGFDPDQEISYSASVNNYYVPIKAVLSNSRYRITTLTVSAATAVNSVYTTGISYYTVSGEETVSYNSSNKTLNASVQATLSNGNTTGSVRTVTIPANLAYTDGENSVTATSIKLNTNWSESSTGYIYETANKRFRVRIIANLSNSKAYGSTIYVPASEAYEAGVASAETAVTIKSIALNTAWSTSSTGYVYQTANKRYAVNVKATASNENYSTNTLYVPATDAYDAGYEAGVSDGSSSGASKVYTTAINYYTLSGEQTVSYNASNKTLNASVQATLSNGNTTGSVRTVTIPATLAYNAGWNAVTVDSVAMDGTATYQTGYKRYAVKVKGTASNGAYKTSTVYVSASEAYNAGYYAGQASASGYTNIYYAISDSQTSKKIVINVVVYGYDGSQYVAVASGRHEYNK